MLTRLKVSGFKNLVDVDVRFGPFTCIAGPNGAGKSNLFDAIQFLSALADHSVIEAALSVRGAETGDIRSIFHQVGDKYDDEMSFEAEMIIPSEGIDDFGQPVKAPATFLRYSITIAYREGDDIPAIGSLQLIKEELVSFTKNDAREHLLFPHTASTWRKNAVHSDGKTTFIDFRPEMGPNGRVERKIPSTVLALARGENYASVLLARREMQSWQTIQLEPPALRKPDSFSVLSTLERAKLASDGSHLPAILYRLARSKDIRMDGESSDDAAARVYSQLTNRLAELIDDIYHISVDRDDKRALLTLQATDRSGTTYPASVLSDGTLRFLALAVLGLDPEAPRLVCLEEPENGIHPKRIPAMLQLLYYMATDPNEPVDFTKAVPEK